MNISTACKNLSVYLLSDFGSECHSLPKILSQIPSLLKIYKIHDFFINPDCPREQEFHTDECDLQTVFFFKNIGTNQLLIYLDVTVMFETLAKFC